VIAESVEHVLAHCLPLMSPIKARHDAKVNRLAEALPRSTKYLLDKRSVAAINQRPDITVWSAKGDVVLVDVTCPFEGHERALDDAFQTKIVRYSSLALQMLTRDLRSAVVRPFVVGALGGWLPGNEQCLNDLEIPRYRRKLLRELCVADAIVGSETIWARIESGLTDRGEADASPQPLPDAGSQPALLDDAARHASNAC